MGKLQQDIVIAQERLITSYTTEIGMQQWSFVTHVAILHVQGRSCMKSRVAFKVSNYYSIYFNSSPQQNIVDPWGARKARL